MEEAEQNAAVAESALRLTRGICVRYLYNSRTNFN